LEWYQKWYKSENHARREGAESTGIEDLSRRP
jgi:hypothetical protein